SSSAAASPPGSSPFSPWAKITRWPPTPPQPAKPKTAASKLWSTRTRSTKTATEFCANLPDNTLPQQLDPLGRVVIRKQVSKTCPIDESVEHPRVVLKRHSHDN